MTENPSKRGPSGRVITVDGLPGEMAEWPKRVTVGADYKGDGPIKTGRWINVDVIPADLGRELYEALKREAKLGPFGRSDIARKALTRYEREVGE